MKKITLETLSNLNQSALMELFYNEFLRYGKKCALYVAHNHDMSIEYCTNYIASGLFELFLTRCEKLHSEEKNTSLWFSRETMLYSFLGTKKLVKKIMAMTNYSSYFKNNEKAYTTTYKDNMTPSALAIQCEQIDGAVFSPTHYKLNKQPYSKNRYSEYRNVKKVNAHTIDIIDVLEQKENRTSKKSLSIDSDLFEGVSFRDTIKSYYPTPEEELLNKLSRVYSHKIANKIKAHKKYNTFYSIATSEEVQNKSEQNFIAYFKKSMGLENLNTRELLYIVSNY